MNTLATILVLFAVFVIFIGFIWFVVASIFFERVTAPIPTRSCPQCTYSVASLPAPGICPECGSAYGAFTQSVQRSGFAAHRVPIVLAVVFLSAINLVVIAAIPYPVAFVAYRLATDWSARDCSFHAARAAGIDAGAFVPVLFFQTWIISVVAVRAQIGRTLLLAMSLALGGVLGMVVGSLFPTSWNQGMFTYFIDNPAHRTHYAIGAMIGLIVWCATNRKTLRAAWLDVRPQQAVGSTEPPSSTLQ